MNSKLNKTKVILITILMGIIVLFISKSYLNAQNSGNSLTFPTADKTGFFTININNKEAARQTLL